MKNRIYPLMAIFLILSSGYVRSPQDTLAHISGPISARTVAGDLGITIDGDPGDWAGITPFLVDPTGDSLSGPDTDLVNVSYDLDSTYGYLMIRTASDIRKETGNATIELNLDLRPGNSVCYRQDELHLNINYPDTLYAWTRDTCDSIKPFPIDPSAVSMAWGSVLEVRILRSALGPMNYFRPIFTAFWTDVSGAWTNVDMVWIPQISGTVRDSTNRPVSGVTLSTGTGYSATTDSSGFYSIGVPIGDYVVTPTMKCQGGRNSLMRCIFSPASRSYSDVEADVYGQDFSMKRVH